MRRDPILALLLSALALLFQPAAAQMSAEGRASRWFAEHDRNGDGYLQVDEVLAYEAKVFRRMDEDGDGRLRQDEYCGGIPSANTAELDRCHARFARIDANGDAYVILAEIQAFDRMLLQAADEDGDGKVSLREFLAASQGD